MKNESNIVLLEGKVNAIEPLRYTPAGFPVIRLTMLHESEQIENGQIRKIALEIVVCAVGDVTKNLLLTGQLARIQVKGFLAPLNRHRTQLILHASEIVRIQD